MLLTAVSWCNYRNTMLTSQARASRLATPPQVPSFATPGMVEDPCEGIRAKDQRDEMHVYRLRQRLALQGRPMCSRLPERLCKMREKG